jgi:hypothetical protein
MSPPRKISSLSLQDFPSLVSPKEISLHHTLFDINSIHYSAQHVCAYGEIFTLRSGTNLLRLLHGEIYQQGRPTWVLHPEMISSNIN